MNTIVDVGGMRGIPHAVLQEPEQRITEDAVKLIVCAPPGKYKSNV
jgi:hypothetical protein